MSTPLDDFFARFANLNIGFTYRRNRTAHNNFQRLHRVLEQEGTPTEVTIARVEFNDALVEQFNFTFGTASDLDAWQNLCSVIDISPIPDSIKECQRVVWDANVNIVDMLEATRTGKKVRKFATLEELQRYTKRPGKMFPKESAYTGGLLKELLREIINPYFGRRRNGSEKRKRRKAQRRVASAQSQ